MNANLLLLVRLSLIALCAALLPSCASTPRYEQAKASGQLSAKPGRSLVVMYWDSSFLTTKAGDYNVYASPAEGVPEQRVVKGLKKGKFCTIDAVPGSVSMSVRHTTGVGSVLDGVVSLVYSPLITLSPKPSLLTLWKKGQLSLVTEAGRIYFVHARWKRFAGHAELHEVTEAEALPELSRCRWLNPR